MSDVLTIFDSYYAPEDPWAQRCRAALAAALAALPDPRAENIGRLLAARRGEIETLKVENARLAARDHRPGPLVTCPWCGADQRGRIAEAQIGHLIACGDHVRARLQGILDNEDE